MADFLFAIIKHFLVALTVAAFVSRHWSKSALFRGGWVTLSANFRWKGTSHPTSVGIRKLEYSCYLIVKTT